MNIKISYADKITLYKIMQITKIVSKERVDANKLILKMLWF